jgi:hypothetical protein
MRNVLFAAFFASFLLIAPFASAQTITSGSLTFPVIIVVIMGIMSALYVMMASSKVPLGQLTINKAFKGFMILGTSFIAIAEIILAIEALGIAQLLPLPIVHDTLMAISLVFIALGVRELMKQKPAL